MSSVTRSNRRMLIGGKPALRLRVEFARFGFFGEDFDDIFGFDILEIAHPDSAFKTFFDFLHIVFKTPERFEHTLMDHDAVAQDTRLGPADKLSFQDKAPADGTALGEFIDF